MKTIFVTIGEEIIFRNIFTKAFLKKMLSDKNLKFVFVVLEEKKDMIVNAIADNPAFEGRIVFESYKRGEFGLYERFFNMLARSGINSHTNLWSKMRSYERGHSSYLSTIFKRLISFVFGGCDLFKHWVRFMLLKSPSDAKLVKLYDIYKPDVLFATSLTNFDFDVLVAREAKKRGIKIVGMIRSWDNFSSHGLLRTIPDTLLIQNQFLIDMAAQYQAIHQKDVPMTIIGLPHYDDSFNVEKMIEPREVFMARLGMKPGQRYALYGAMGDFLFINESRDMPKVFDTMIADKKMHLDKIIYRSHPKFKVDKADAYQNVLIDMSGEYVKDGNKGISNNAYLINSIYHASVLITGASTMAIDAAVIDKPVVCVAFDGLSKESDVRYYNSTRRFYDLYTHFEALVETGGLRVAYNADELGKFVNQYIENPKLDQEGRDRIKDYFCYKIDGQSSNRLFDAFMREISVEKNKN